MDGWVFAIGDQRTDAFGTGEVKRHGNNGGSEGVAANHQHSGGDATDERNWIHGRRRKSGSTLARLMALQWFGSPPNVGQSSFGLKFAGGGRPGAPLWRRPDHRSHCDGGVGSADPYN